MNRPGEPTSIELPPNAAALVIYEDGSTEMYLPRHKDNIPASENVLLVAAIMCRMQDAEWATVELLGWMQEQKRNAS